MHQRGTFPMLRHQLLSSVIGTAALISCHAQSIKPDHRISDSPSSIELLARADEAYKKLDAYQDEGTSITKFEKSSLDQTNELHFTTAYSKAGKFRFEFWEPSRFGGESRMVVWKDGNVVKSWWTVNPVVESHESLGSAISGATGVSSGTAYLVPSVLMKEAAWKSCTWTCSKDTYRIQDGIEGGNSFFRVQHLTSTKAEKIFGVDSPGTKGKVTYWISKDKYMLFRVDEETDFGEFFTRETIKYVPKFNVPIPNKAFEFAH